MNALAGSPGGGTTARSYASRKRDPAGRVMRTTTLSVAAIGASPLLTTVMS